MWSELQLYSTFLYLYFLVLGFSCWCICFGSRRNSDEKFVELYIFVVRYSRDRFLPFVTASLFCSPKNACGAFEANWRCFFCFCGFFFKSCSTVFVYFLNLVLLNFAVSCLFCKEEIFLLILFPSLLCFFFIVVCF